MSRLIKQYLPITTWLPAYKRSWLHGDLFAGLTVGIMLIPQGMAYAMIAGLPPVYGLYASIVPQIIYAIFGTSRQLSVAPVAMDSLLVASGVSVMATQGTDAYITLAVLVAFFMGLFQLLLGIFRLGFITNLLSRPVISGFTSAAALIIGFNQLKYLLGINVVKSNRVMDILVDVTGKIDQTHVLTLLIGIGGILIIRYVKNIHRKIPGALVAVAAGTLLAFFFSLHHKGVTILETIPKGLPAFELPDFTAGDLAQLIPLALTISVVAFMEAFSVSKALEAKKQDHKVQPNQELIALGAANVLGSFFQSFSVTGGFSRSAVNYQAGAHTPLASVISAVLISLTLLFLTPLFYYLPEAILASVILVAVAGLIDVKYAVRLWKVNKAEFAVLILTFAVTVHFSMVPGIVTGIVASVLLLLYRTAYPHMARLGRVPGHHEFRNIRRFRDLENWNDLVIIRMDAPLNFMNIQAFRDFTEHAVIESPGPVKAVVLDASSISAIDATATADFCELLATLKERQIRFIITDVIGPVRDTLTRNGIWEIIGRENVYLTLNEAIETLTGTVTRPAKTSYALQSDI